MSFKFFEVFHIIFLIRYWGFEVYSMERGKWSSRRRGLSRNMKYALILTEKADFWSKRDLGCWFLWFLIEMGLRMLVVTVSCLDEHVGDSLISILCSLGSNLWFRLLKFAFVVLFYELLWLLKSSLGSKIFSHNNTTSDIWFSLSHWRKGNEKIRCRNF